MGMGALRVIVAEVNRPEGLAEAGVPVVLLVKKEG